MAVGRLNENTVVHLGLSGCSVLRPERPDGRGVTNQTFDFTVVGAGWTYDMVYTIASDMPFRLEVNCWVPEGMYGPSNWRENIRPAPFVAAHKDNP